MSDTAALVNMLTFGRILAENLDKKAETDLQHAWKAEQLKLEKDKLTLSKEKMDADLIQDQNEHNMKLRTEYDDEFLEDSDRDGYDEVKTGTKFTDSNTFKTQLEVADYRVVQNYIVDNPSFAKYTEGLSISDQKNLMSEWNIYKNMGVNYENGQVINEDLYKKYDNSYKGLGRLWAVDLDSSGYLGYNDKVQAEKYIEDLMMRYDVNADYYIPDSDQEVLREWGVLSNVESFGSDPAANKALIDSINVRTSAFLSGLDENENLMTERQYTDFLIDQDHKQILFSDAILGSVAVTDLKSNYESLYANIQKGLINTDGYVIGAIDDLRDLDIFQEKAQKKWTKTTNQATTNFLVSLRTGGEGYGHLKRFSHDIGPNGYAIIGSEFHEVYSGLMKSGLDTQARNLLLAVQQYGKYTQYISSGSAYVEGSIDNPEKMTARTMMVRAIDEKDSNGLSLRDKLFLAADTGKQDNVNSVIELIGAQFKQLNVGGAEIPYETRKEWLELLMSQVNAYITL